MSQLPGKKLYSIPEIYKIAVNAIRSVSDLKRGRSTGVLPPQFQERIMLAVTSVNQCAMCSYAHTEMALKAGMTSDEIQGLLSGDFPDLPPEEAKAVLFAQHYADTRGNPDPQTWQELRSAYGEPKAAAVLGAVRIIMLGNSLGIAAGSLRDRLRGKGGDSRSSLLYELGVLITMIPGLPLAALQALLMNLFRCKKI